MRTFIFSMSFLLLLFKGLTIIPAPLGTHNQMLDFPSQDTIEKDSFNHLLNLYFDIKNALANDDANTASAKAGSFVNALKAVNQQQLSDSARKSFESLREKLDHDADHMSEVNDIDHQRHHFMTFSANMWELAKLIKLSNEPIYRQYCPMKKAYWISSDSTIKNPYYGKKMSECGQLTATIK